MPTDSIQYTAAFVDHEKKFIDEWLRRVESLKDLDRRCVGARFKLGVVVVKPGKRLAERAAEEIPKQCGRQPDIVLVDLCFGEDDVHSGWQLAVDLREKLWPIPVGAYTRHPLHPRDRALISADGLAALLEDFREMCDGPDKRLTAHNWLSIFDEIITKARAARENPAHAMRVPGGHEHVVWEPGHPTTGSVSFREAARRLAASGLAWLKPPASRVTLTQLGGGFSGAYVVKAAPEGRPKSFVLKIDEDPRKLRRELHGYRTVSSWVQDEYCLPILGPDASNPVTLTAEWWAAFVMPYEEDAKPLIEHGDIGGQELADLYRAIWERCLFDLYGNITSSDVTPEAIGADAALSSAKGGLQSLRRYRSRQTELSEPLRQPIERAVAQLEFPDNKAWGFADGGRGPWAERVHGDLNCRNVLYRRDQRRFKLIDFPNVDRNCLAVDFVKAEAELVLIVMDWATGRDCDFSRIEAWGALTGVLAAEFSPKADAATDTEAMRVLAAIRTIRELYRGKAGITGALEYAYRLYLLARVLRYIGYSDLTIAKRFLALLWAGQLVDARW